MRINMLNNVSKTPPVCLGNFAGKSISEKRDLSKPLITYIDKSDHCGAIYQELTANLEDGLVVIAFPDKRRFVGHIMEGKMSAGQMYWEDGKHYKGIFEKGKVTCAKGGK